MAKARICFLLCSLIGTAFASTAEELLVQKLFNGYNKLVRPVRHESEIIDVDFGLALIQIINVDEKNQILKSNVWERYLWHDYQLKWNPDEHNGITIIRVASEKVWTPDIVLFNNADGNYEVDFKCNVVVSYDGMVLWVPPAIFESSCAIDVTYFPFDEQRCELRFGSWTFGVDKLHLGHYDKRKHIDLTDYVKSGTWDIIGVPAVSPNYSAEASADDANSANIVFWVKIRRKTLFYAVNLVIPCVLLTFLSLLVFYLPVDCGEKMTLALSLLLALVVFLNLVSIILPPSSMVIPLVAKYLLFTFIMNVITILVTVVVINWNFRQPTTHTMSPWISTLFLDFLPKLFCLSRPKHEQDPLLVLLSSTDANRLNINILTGDLSLNELHHPSCSHLKPEHEIIIEKDDDEGMISNADADRTISAIDFIIEHLRMEDEIQKNRQDWQFVAMVLDRLLLLIFFTVSVVGTGSVMMDEEANVMSFVDQDNIIYIHSQHYDQYNTTLSSIM